MKRVFVPLLAITVIAVLFAGCAQPAPAPSPAPAPAPAPAPQETITLKFVAGTPTASIEYDHIDAFFQAVEERSDGVLHVDYYVCPTLCAQDQILDSIRTGVADMGQVACCYEQSMLPFDYAWGLPPLWDSPEESFAMYEAVYDEFQKPRYDELGVHYLGYCIIPGFWLFTIDKPVYSIADLKGMSIRSFSESYAKVWTACDAIPVNVSFPDQYEALQKGTLQASPNCIHNVPGTGIYELGDPGYVIDMGGLPSTSNLFCMNQAKYNSLSPDLQQIIDECSYEFLSVQGYEDLMTATEESLEFLEDYGCEVIYWSDTEKANIVNEIMLPQWDEYAADLDSKGLPGSAFVAKVKSLAK